MIKPACWDNNSIVLTDTERHTLMMEWCRMTGKYMTMKAVRDSIEAMLEVNDDIKRIMEND